MPLDDENPFDSGTAGDAPSQPVSGVREPVAMEIGAVVVRAWEIFTENVLVVAAAILIPAGISMVFIIPSQVAQGMVGAMRQSGHGTGMIALLGLIALALNLAQLVVSLYLQLGAVRIYTNLAFGREATVGMLFGEGAKLLTMLGATILAGLAILVGVILLIVPGVILALGLQFYTFAIVDENLGVIEALKESWRLADGYKVFLFGIGLVLTVVASVVAVFTCGLGLLAVIPTLALVQAVMYHSLVSEKGRAATASFG